MPLPPPPAGIGASGPRPPLPPFTTNDEATPPPRASPFGGGSLPFARPPLGIGGIRGIGGICGAPAGAMSSLNLAPKSTAPKVPRDLPFGALLTTYISSPTTPLFTTLSFTVQMRHLDDLRSHNTGVAEQELLNVPGSEARLLVDVPKNLMKLCGSGKGVRFSTKDITEIKRIAERIGEAFGRMDGAFKGLNVGERKGKGDEADR